MARPLPPQATDRQQRGQLGASVSAIFTSRRWQSPGLKSSECRREACNRSVLAVTVRARAVTISLLPPRSDREGLVSPLNLSIQRSSQNRSPPPLCQRAPAPCWPAPWPTQPFPCLLVGWTPSLYPEVSGWGSRAAGSAGEGPPFPSVLPGGPSGGNKPGPSGPPHSSVSPGTLPSHT